jgi:tetratricopeptide (TPR) repeat protein
MKLHLLSKKAIEYGLPAIVLLVPLLINPYGYTVYPYPKIAFFRFTTLLLLTTWLVDRIVLRRSVAASLRKLLARPLVVPVFLFTLTYLLATVASVAPLLSFWGSHIRAYGTYTVLCYVIFFFLIILNLRTARQRERLITVALLASLPVAFYGVLQHFGIDPLFPKEDYSGRVISTIGNPIFLGAYLIMVIPLAFGRLLVSLRTLLGRDQLASSRRSMLLEVIGYSSLLLLQLTCLLYTKARGPWLGLLGGVFLFAVLIALQRKMKKLLLITMTAGVVLIALLIALNLPNTPLAPLTKSPYLSRLVLTDQLTAGKGTGWVRLLVWQGTLELIKTRPNVGFTPDPLRPFRLLIGYGPDTMGITFSQVYPAGLAYAEQREAIPDRAHNELLDLVVTTGALGLLAFLFLMGSFFYYGLSLLRQARSFKVQVTLVALLSAMFAHLVEAQFGLLLSTAETLLWLFLGLVSVMCTPRTETIECESETNLDNANRLRSILSLLVVCIIPFFASLSNVNFLLADVYTRQGLQFRNARQYAESITAHNRAIQVFPVESKLYQYKAAAYCDLAQSISDDELEARGQLLQAGVDALAKALALQPLNPEYYADTGKLYGYWARTVNPDKFDQAVEFYERALQLAPHDAVYRNDLARVYFDAGRFEEAIRHLRLSLEIDPKFHATHYNLGLVYLKLGEKNKAEEHFETALLLDPGCEECVQQLEALESD